MVVVPRAEVPSTPMEDELPVNTGDLMHLRRLVEEKDGGPSWIHVMERTLPTMRCQAWRRDPEGVPRPSVPRRNKPHRADLYYSSWCIRPDTGIPCEIAKLGVRQGMRNCKAWLFMTTGGLACASSSVVVSPASMVQSEVVSPTESLASIHIPRQNFSPMLRKPTSPRGHRGEYHCAKGLHSASKWSKSNRIHFTYHHSSVCCSPNLHRAIHRSPRGHRGERLRRHQHRREQSECEAGTHLRLRSSAYSGCISRGVPEIPGSSLATNRAKFDFFRTETYIRQSTVQLVHIRVPV